MCGRYVAARRRQELIETFEVDHDATQTDLAPDYNVAPTRQVYGVVARPDSGQRRELRTLRWGLVPPWADDPRIGNRMINARLETVATKPAYRHAFRRRRCLLPADGYYEWYTPGTGRKQPFLIRPRDGGVLAFAGLYELWRPPRRDDEDPETTLWTCTIITTRAEGGLRRIHDRMPVLVELGRWADWLDPRLTTPEEVRAVIEPATPDRLEVVPVSPAVNDVRYRGPVEILTGDAGTDSLL